MEQGTKAFETYVVSTPHDGTLQPGLDKALEDRGIPSPVRAQQPVIHKQQDISVDYTNARHEEAGLPRAL